MAARTGASIGVAIAITVLAVFAFTFFVLTLVFFGRAQDATKGKETAEAAITDFVTEQQRTQTSVQQALREAKAKGPNTTVVSDLIATQRDIMERVTGNRDMSPTQFFGNLEDIEDSDTAPLFALINQRDENITSLTAARDAAEAGRLDAIERADAEAKRVSELSEEYKATGSRLIAEVGDYTQQIEATRNAYGQTEERLQGNLENTVTTFENKERDYRAQIAQMTNENLILQDQLRRLRQEGAADRVNPLGEESLVDGSVQAINPADREVVLSIGREHKVILGMTFAVYSDATDIRPNALTGDYPAGKATLEVVRVEDGFSRARVITESRGNPIVRGDVVANAVYDPSKTYKFVVYGLFDMNRDGIKSRFESDDVAAMIRTWGGQVVTDLEGDLDFVVLGERPTLPPRPGLSAGPDEINAFIEIQGILARYDDLREKAISTAVPILNENRLRTLIGDYPN